MTQKKMKPRPLASRKNTKNQTKKKARQISKFQIINYTSPSL